MHSSHRPAAARAAPWVLLVVGLALELATPEAVRATPLFALAAVIAGALLSLRQTLAVGATAFALEVFITAVLGTQHQIHEYIDALNIVFACLTGVVVNRMLLRYDRARDTAEAAQRAVLPDPPGRLGDIELAAEYRAALHGTRVGGDFYAAQAGPYGVRVVIGDIRGKGLGAIGLVSVQLGAFREWADDVPDLAALADRMERATLREAQRRGDADAYEGFATALLAQIPPGAREVRLLSRGHPAPYLFPPGAPPRELPCAQSGLPLGLGPLAPGAESETAESVHALPPGALLLFVTDGVTEARDASGTFFDPATAMPAATYSGPAALLDAVDDAVRTWSDGARDDDMALLALAPTTSHD
ncbi:PP2C family protein-serine/threonine phosphatase [Streptomyces sp. NPDC050085]|uniref:PP2C family protein-serine/threonine phosphatase n=1 Tax=Streptomyces sp. NPDC050085 TaxID=3365600 RepID=UPI0037907B0C